jgi:cytochrome aa3-600 menaquinol oxidase subunit 2
MPEDEFDEWVDEVKETAKPLSEEKFNELLEPGHLGQLTFTGTHLEFSPPHEGHHGQESSDTEEETEADSHEENSDHSHMNH